jgi:hypothetical protein
MIEITDAAVERVLKALLLSNKRISMTLELRLRRNADIASKDSDDYDLICSFDQYDGQTGMSGLLTMIEQVESELGLIRRDVSAQESTLLRAKLHVLDLWRSLSKRRITKMMKPPKRSLKSRRMSGEKRRGDARSRKSIERVAEPTPAPATREEAVKIAARLFTLGHICSDVSLPLKIAAAWLHLADVAAFADRVEKCARALVGLFDEYMGAHADAMERALRDTRLITEADIQSARKQIGRLARIADGSIGLDIGPRYLPAEFRPEGFVEEPYRGPAEFIDERGDDGEDDKGGEDDEL